MRCRNHPLPRCGIVIRIGEAASDLTARIEFYECYCIGSFGTERRWRTPDHRPGHKLASAGHYRRRERTKAFRTQIAWTRIKLAAIGAAEDRYVFGFDFTHVRRRYVRGWKQ